MRQPFARLAAVPAYLFMAALIYLAGIYVSRMFYVLYVLLVSIPVLSLLQVLISLFRLRYSQDFDTEHPVKGESIGYRLNIANESLVASCVVTVRFMEIHPDLDTSLEGVSTVFRSRSGLHREYHISCPYRGIYTVGLKSLRASDLLGWVEFRLPVYHRTFYVYPRIVDIEPTFAGSRTRGLSRISHSGREPDAALFEGLEDYREGQPVRYLAWKKLFATGNAFLRRFGHSAEPGLTLYLDLRRNGTPEPSTLEAEDCSVEIAVALVKYCLDHRIRTTVRAMGRELYSFAAGDPSAFERFYRDTINLVFQRSISPAELFASDQKRAAVEGAVFIITHIPDPEVLELLEAKAEESIGVIVNETSMEHETRSSLMSFRESLGETAGRLILIEGPETIREDLGA